MASYLKSQREFVLTFAQTDDLFVKCTSARRKGQKSLLHKKFTAFVLRCSQRKRKVLQGLNQLKHTQICTKPCQRWNAFTVCKVVHVKTTGNVYG